MKRPAQLAGFVLFVLVGVAFAYNVLSDNYAVEQAAKAVACGDQGDRCNARVTRMERNPFAQTFEIATSKRDVGVKCMRSLVLVGEYGCTLR